MAAVVTGKSRLNSSTEKAVPTKKKKSDTATVSKSAITTESEQLTLFKNMTEGLGKWAYKGQSFTPYLMFQIGDDDTGVVFTTHSKNSNYFMSFSHTHSGAGAANEFTLTLAFAPSPTTDISKMEKLFNTTSCKYRYGYDQPYVLSPTYKGILLKYSVSMNNNLLTYTLSGYGSVIESNEHKFSFEQIGEYVTETSSDSTTITTTVKNGIRPTEFLAGEVNKKAKSYHKKISIDKNAYQKDQEVVIPAMSEMTLPEVIDKVLSLAYCLDSDGQNDGSQFYYYTIPHHAYDEVDEFVVKRVVKDNSVISKITTAIEFDWGGLSFNKSPYTANIVQNFSAEYDGSIAIAATSQDTDGGENVYALDKYGQVVTTRLIADSAKAGDDLSNIQIENYNKWAKLTQYSYEATLELVGIPCEIPMGTYIKVRPLIYGIEHHTGGTYFTETQTDKLDASGFSTTVKLLKVLDERDSAIYQVPDARPSMTKEQAATNLRVLKEAGRVPEDAKGTVYLMNANDLYTDQWK